MGKGIAAPKSAAAHGAAAFDRQAAEMAFPALSTRFQEQVVVGRRDVRLNVDATRYTVVKTRSPRWRAGRSGAPHPPQRRRCRRAAPPAAQPRSRPELA